MAASKTPSLLPLMAIHIVLGIAGIVVAVIAVRIGGMWATPMLTGGIAGGAIALATLPATILLHHLAGRQVENASSPETEELRLLAQINEHTLLSDKAKRLIYRAKELHLLRSAIEDDIRQGDYDAALILCETMSQDFGFREESETFRASIEAARHEQYETQVREALHSLDDRLAARDWAAAHAESARIRRLFPDAPVIGELEHRISGARQEHKEDLERQFLEAAQHEDVEAAMEHLRQLDRYLTSAEAERLTEVAQGVVSKHRENLGVQFKLAVADRSWSEAVRIGDEIIGEFPNSKMAEEVRSMLDLLRTRASQAAVSAARD